MASKRNKASNSAWKEEGCAAISVLWTKRLMTESINAVFKVVYKGTQGTGAFYEVFDTRNLKRWLFITCNHVVPTNSVKDILDFMQIFYPHIGTPNDNSLLELKQEYLLRCWTRHCYCIDATVIELSAEGEKYLRALNVTFLKTSNGELNELVAILQIPEGQTKFAYGKISAVQESLVFYQIATAPGSSGAPLLNQKCEAIAIHIAADPKNADGDKLLTDQPDLPRKANGIHDIIKTFFSEVETL